MSNWHSSKRYLVFWHPTSRLSVKVSISENLPEKQMLPPKGVRIWNTEDNNQVDHFRSKSCFWFFKGILPEFCLFLVKRLTQSRFPNAFLNIAPKWKHYIDSKSQFHQTYKSWNVTWLFIFFILSIRYLYKISSIQYLI